ncbi:MAG: YitT family protein [Oscillospiraceae bacterium]|nr:YitT family protein [Oscillospiraceae bacterium]
MKNIKSYTIITFGSFLVALGVILFFVPNNLAAGGVTGISMILNSIFPFIPIGFLMIVLNVLLFIIAFLILGNKFGAKSIYSGLILSFFIYILEAFLPKNFMLTDDLLLCSVFGTITCAIGMAFVFNQNASTGGTDIIAKILNKFFHYDIGKSLLVVDFLVILGAAAAFGVNRALYGMFCVIINGIIVDSIIDGLNQSKSIFIISKKEKDIIEYIINDLERGCTLLNGQGGYNNDELRVIFSILDRKEFIKLKNYIKVLDDNAFIAVSRASEVLGEGFKILRED